MGRVATSSTRAALSLVFVTMLAQVTVRTQGTVIGSKHDLSTTSTPDACVFCHTPHGASSTIGAPLWNRFIGAGVTFTPYSSSTMDTVCPATPSAISLACLSCHDGVIAGQDKHKVINAPGNSTGSVTSNCSRCHIMRPLGVQPGLRVPGIDLRNDHPISMTYPTAAQDAAFLIPPDLQKGWTGVRLFDGKVECPSCHNVHDPTIRPFLRKTTASDELCKSCHVK